MTIAPKAGVPTVRALERGIALMRAFRSRKPRMTLTELAKATGLDKGTTRRLLQTLTASGLINFDHRNALYGLSVEVLGLASAVELGRDLREIAAPCLAELAEETRATAFLWVHYKGEALCVERARSSRPYVDANWFDVGVRAALNCGAGPRIILAYLDPEDRQAALGMPLVKRTPLSQTDSALLARDADRIRSRGWELAVDDFVVGLAALAVPVLDPRGRFVAAVSITTLTAQIVQHDRAPHRSLLTRIAAEIGSKATHINLHGS